MLRRPLAGIEVLIIATSSPRRNASPNPLLDVERCWSNPPSLANPPSLPRGPPGRFSSDGVGRGRERYGCTRRVKSHCDQLLHHNAPGLALWIAKNVVKDYVFEKLDHSLFSSGWAHIDVYQLSKLNKNLRGRKVERFLTIMLRKIGVFQSPRNINIYLQTCVCKREKCVGVQND